MIKQVITAFLASLLFMVNITNGQEAVNSDTAMHISKLFRHSDIIPIKLGYSNREMRNKTNDSTYLKSDIIYQTTRGIWDTLAVRLRARGNNRRENCYFPPVKVKFKKAVISGTIWEGNKKLKLVLPCLIQKDKNDNVLKEYMAYKLYEVLSPYHFKTRMVAIDYTESRAKKTKEHKLRGFLIEDIDRVAERFEGKELKRAIHPLEHDNICSVQNDFFQYMIGNTDFSVAYQHNEKLVFTGEMKIVPVPYDFDMSGLVNASYAVVSSIQNEMLPIQSVTQRLYRGFKRNAAIYQQVRTEYLSKESQLMDIIDDMKSDFDDPKEFEAARRFIADFFVELKDTSKYHSKILKRARVK